MSSDEDEIPDLVPAQLTKVPITIISGYLGTGTLMIPNKVFNPLVFIY